MTDIELNALAREHGLGPLHPRASGRHAPPEQTWTVPLLEPRSKWLRGAAALGVFLLGTLVSVLYRDPAEPGGSDTVAAIIQVLTWLGVIAAWVMLSHRKRGEQPITGHPLNTLAQLSADVAPDWIELCVPDANEVCDVDDESAPADAPTQSQQLLASEDLIASFGPVYVREKPAPAPMGAKEAHPADTQARRALDVLRQALTAELGLFPDQVWELEATTSNDINAELGGHIDHVSLVIQRGQWRDTDEVCAALLRAVHTLRSRFELMPGEA